MVECAWCGIGFLTTNSRRKYCCSQCSRNAWKAKQNRNIEEEKPKCQSLSEVAREMRERGMTYGGREFKRFGEENEIS